MRLGRARVARVARRTRTLMLQTLSLPRLCRECLRSPASPRAEGLVRPKRPGSVHALRTPACQKPGESITDSPEPKHNIDFSGDHFGWVALRAGYAKLSELTHRKVRILRSVGIEPKSCEGRKTEGLPCKSPVRPRQDFHRTPRYMYTGLVPQGYGLGRPFHGPICTLRSQAGAGPYRFTQRHLGLTPRSSRLAPPALHVDPETAQNSGF